MQNIGLPEMIWTQRFLLVIIRKTVFRTQGCPAGKFVSAEFCQLPVRQAQILVQQLFQKINRSHAVRQHMKNLQIDPPAKIGHPEEIVFICLCIDITAGVGIFPADLRRFLSVLFQIIPEHALTQP